MRFPIRSETDAFRLTAGAAALVVVAVVIGLLSSALVGVIAFAALGLAALGAYLSSADHERRRPLREAAEGPHRRGLHADVRHVLVVANESLEGEELRERIAGMEGERVELDVLAPVLSSRTHLAYTDIDRETRQARERLQRSLAWARAEGFLARGRVGDIPTAAIEDELREFGADEVIVVTAAPGAEHRQEREEIRKLRSELDVPVVQVALSR
ncbi:MAG TPA: hypothetical protein VFW38_07310 [Solirubrobacteraceae bacterium]|nr:hypothetical protein [Solirubrobacteraceae bacterium]